MVHAYSALAENKNNSTGGTPLKICAIIPSYNESKTIGALVTKVRSLGLDVIVVDDGSSDETAEIAKAAGAHVLRNSQNKGKGASLKTSFRYVLTKDYDAVITMDGDGQHAPEDIHKFIDLARGGNIDLIIGNRMADCKNMPGLRRATNSFMSFLISLICGQNFPDSQCGFRLIRRNVLEKINLFCSNYEIETEAIIAAHRQGFKIKFIPIQTIYAQQTSQINPVIDTIRFFKYIFKYGLFGFKKKNG